jgi:uncharacterized membrane protein
MNQHILARIAIYLLSIVMIVFGFYHFMYPRVLLVYVPGYLPGGITWVYIVGVAFILAAIAFILNRGVKIAGYLLAILLLTFVLTVHLPNYLHSGAADMQREAFVSLLKDTALAAFALHIAGSANQKGIVY